MGLESLLFHWPQMLVLSMTSIHNHLILQSEIAVSPILRIVFAVVSDSESHNGILLPGAIQLTETLQNAHRRLDRVSSLLWDIICISRLYVFTKTRT
ncbi:hypothetical protein TNCV_2450751 [Trichonephila clavipes]|nr:hypothetical protein TNCV_2450751 [Trichonephila clavipes]